MSRKSIITLAVVAALSYSSWPLGYWLNPHVAHNALASQLESSHEPFNWLFIGLDLLCGLALLLAGVLQWRRTKSPYDRAAIAFYMLFALLVIVAALIPFNCNTLGRDCSDVVIRSPHAYTFLIHGASSILSIVFLLGGLFLVLGKSLVSKTISRPWLLFLVLLLWGLIGLLAINYRRQTGESIVQDAFISLCSITLLIIITLLESPRFANSTKISAKQKPL